MWLVFEKSPINSLWFFICKTKTNHQRIELINCLHLLSFVATVHLTHDLFISDDMWISWYNGVKDSICYVISLRKKERIDRNEMSWQIWMRPTEKKNIIINIVMTKHTKANRQHGEWEWKEKQIHSHHKHTTLRKKASKKQEWFGQWSKKSTIEKCRCNIRQRTFEAMAITCQYGTRISFICFSNAHFVSFHFYLPFVLQPTYR